MSIPMNERRDDIVYFLLNKIIYGNSRKSRDPPKFFSGDETITRLYTTKATDICMRTSKKNESSILNQNLCGSNQGYSTWKDGDPQGNGFTFCNTAYTGKWSDIDLARSRLLQSSTKSILPELLTLKILEW